MANDSASAAGAGEHPPLPRLCLRVGVSGHRNLPNESQRAIGDQIAKALRTIADAALSLRGKHFSAEPNDLRLVTPAAAGSDIIAGEAALATGWRIDCPLPFERAEYEKDFTDAAWLDRHRKLIAAAEGRVFALDGQRAAQDRAYETVGLFVLHRSDILLAVWNGEEGAGRGGTYEILDAAYAAGIPILWFQPDGSTPRLLWRTEEALAELRDAAAASQPVAPALVQDVVRWIVAPPTDKPGMRLERFLFQERPPKGRSIWVSFAWLELLAGSGSLIGALTAGKTWPLGVKTEQSWNKAYWPNTDVLAEQDAPLSAAIRALLQPRYGWADELAVHFAQIYRSAYVYVFGLGATAVFFALLGAFGGLTDAKLWFVGVEMIILGLIWRIVRYGVKRGWHRRFVEYRHLAELLRPWRVLAHAGGVTPALQTPDGGKTADNQWIIWYLRATVRELPMPSGAATQDRVDAIRGLLVASEIAQQVEFQHRTTKRWHVLESRLEKAGLAAFGLTGAICAFYLLLNFYVYVTNPGGHPHEDVSSAVTFLTALLPAIGSALFGIRVQGDFAEASKRADAMAKRLEQISARIAPQTAPTFAAVSRMAEDSAEAMASEVADWAFIYRAKPLTLPG